jgi:hydroxymethylbilane synthase
VRAALGALYPSCAVTILGMTTRGDQILDRALSKVGGKGLFVKELESALLDGRAQLAVHSLKDVPMNLPPEFQLAAILKREDPRDAFVSTRYASLAEMPAGSRVGSSSLRRAMQIRAMHPGLDVQPVRGNLDTRLAKLDRGEFDALVLAAAGLKRLGLAARIRAILATEDSLPSAGQGALAIEVVTADADTARCVAALNHEPTARAVEAERSVSRALGGSCELPLAAYCEIEPDGSLRLRARIGSEDGRTVLAAEAAGTEPAALGATVARQLLDQGADRFAGGPAVSHP